MLQPWAAVMPQRFSMGIWTEAPQTHFLPRGCPLMGMGLARGHPARLPNTRSSVAPRHSRGPSCPPCADPVCSFLMSSKSRMDPGPFSSLGHLGGSRWGWVWMRWWGTKKIPFWDEHKSGCQHQSQNPPLEPSQPSIPLQDGADGKAEEETPLKRPWEHRDCCSRGGALPPGTPPAVQGGGEAAHAVPWQSKSLIPAEISLCCLPALLLEWSFTNSS